MRVSAIICCFAAALPAAAGSVTVFERSYPSNNETEHYRFGLDMGREFSDIIATRMAANSRLQDHVLPFLRTNNGSRVYQTLHDSHSKRYPLYMQELHGVATGAGQDFASIFAMNLVQEFLLFAPNSTSAEDQCSDYVVHDTSARSHFILHNEDSVLADRGCTFLAKVRFGEKSFTAYTYAGDLPTGAFGFVSGKFAFTLNKVPPSTPDLSQSGAGRGFVSRALLDAAGYADGLRVVRETPMIAGHNYQVMDLEGGGGVVNVEAYHAETTATHLVEDGHALFHANRYDFLVVPQQVDWGSTARSMRAAQMPVPTDLQGAVVVLGDQANASYPVMHDQAGIDSGDITGLWTLCTAHFDLLKRTLSIYEGNPKEGKIVHTEKLG
eukprot:TRINITY_DN2844_c0_g1_i1.p1 TRINITY_DN2844_c0_g1~~TRINITY_DN2844_c0_g1_i1.p1  ORF type:complete len:382 (+),score=145.74 TRINITY_DN2844_c0_g1_i1:66-1211(+)